MNSNQNPLWNEDHPAFGELARASRPAPCAVRRPRIVVGVDGSDASIDAVRWASRQAHLTGADLEGIISWYPSANYGSDLGMSEHDWAYITLDVAVEHALGVPAETIVTKTVRGHAAEVQLAVARGANMLVVGSRGLGLLHRMLTGSVSERIVSRSCCSLRTGTSDSRRMRDRIRPTGNPDPPRTSKASPTPQVLTR